MIPKAKDHCKIIYGDDQGDCGVVLSIFQHEATIKVGERKRFMPLNYLCMMQENGSKE